MPLPFLLSRHTLKIASRINLFYSLRVRASTPQNAAAPPPSALDAQSSEHSKKVRRLLLVAFSWLLILLIGAGTDAYTSYTQRGALHVNTHTLDAICELFPQFRRMRMLRNWGGIVDVTPDRSPIIAKTPVPGLYVNCGWGTGGFKATPGSAHVFAWTIARDEPHPINAPFTIERFRDGQLIDEAAAAAVAH